MRFEHKLFPLGCQEMIGKGSHIRDGGAAEEALKPQLSGFQVSSCRSHGELGKEPIGAARKMRRGAGPHYSSLTAKRLPTTSFTLTELMIRKNWATYRARVGATIHSADHKVES